MTNAIQIFSNDTFGDIRTLNEEGKVLFCGKDIAEVLGYSNVRDALAKHCRCVAKRDVPHPQSPSKEIEMSFIPEGDVIRLICNSKLPTAEKFERWVFDEVVPSVLHTGSYSLASQLPDFTDPVAAARAWADEVEKKRALDAKIEKDKPNTDFGKALSHVETYVLVSQAANQMKQAGCTFVCFDGDREERKPIGPKYLRKYLENEGYVVKPGRRDSGRPTDKGSKNGRIREKAHIWGPTSNYTSYTPELSPAFVKHLIQRFKDNEIRIEKILH